jgi:hypothetical protein
LKTEAGKWKGWGRGGGEARGRKREGEKGGGRGDSSRASRPRTAPRALRAGLAPRPIPPKRAARLPVPAGRPPPFPPTDPFTAHPIPRERAPHAQGGLRCGGEEAARLQRPLVPGPPVLSWRGMVCAAPRRRWRCPRTAPPRLAPAGGGAGGSGVRRGGLRLVDFGI